MQKGLVDILETRANFVRRGDVFTGLGRENDGAYFLRAATI